MNDLKIPIITHAAEVLLRSGQRMQGQIFLPAVAPLHEGPMRPMEWLNLPASFLPFLPNDAADLIILNKLQVVVLTVAATDDVGELPDAAGIPMQRVSLELDTVTLEGTVLLEMPENQVRVLDLLNCPDTFITLCNGDRHHLVRKEHIVVVREIEEH